MMQARQHNLPDSQYNSIDLAKFFCAILVVMIHVSPFGDTVSSPFFVYCNFGIKNYLARIAVPFFFVSSGFLLYRKTSYNHFYLDIPKKFVLRMLRLYLIWTLIYFPLVFKSLISNEKGIVSAFLGYFRNVIFTGSYTQLWFFPALFFAVCLISFLLFKNIKPKYIVIISFAFYLIGLLGQSWYGLIVPLRESIPELWSVLKFIKRIILTTRDGLFEAFFFVSIGMLFAFYDIKIRSKTALSLFVLSMFLMCVEVFGLEYAGYIRAHDMYFFLVPVTFFFFLYVIGLRLPNSPVYKILRLLSSLIFYLHLWVKWAVSKLLRLIYSPLADTFINFLLVLILTIVFSFAVIKLSNYKYFKWLKYLYT